MFSGFDARLWLTLAAAFVAAAAAVAALVRGAPSGVDERRRSRDPLPPLWRMAMPLVRLLEGTAAATMSPQRRLALEARLQQAGLARMLTPARHRAACWVGGAAGGDLFHLQLLEHIAGREQRCRALLDQHVAAGAAGMEDAPRHGKDVAALFGGETGSDQRTTAFARFDDDHAFAQAADDAVARGEVAGVGASAQGVFAD